MLSRALRGGHRALPSKRNVTVYVPLVRRSVTTDAASSHAEKEHVPEVSRAPQSERAPAADLGVRFQEDDEPFQVTLSNESFETYELDPPPYTLNTTKKELKRMYYDMVSIR